MPNCIVANCQVFMTERKIDKALKVLAPNRRVSTHAFTKNHPLFKEIWSCLHEGIVSTAHLEHLPDGTPVEVAGLVVCRQRPGTAKGFVFLLLEDESGMANVVIKPGLYQRCRSLVRAEPFVVVRGELRRRDGTTNVIAGEIRPLQVATSVTAPSAHSFG